MRFRTPQPLMLALVAVLSVAVLSMAGQHDSVSEAAGDSADCIWIGETRAAPDLSDQAQAAVRAAGLAQAQVTAFDFGERCSNRVTGARQQFAPEHTEYHVSTAVTTLADRDAVGTLASTVAAPLTSLSKRGSASAQIRLEIADGRDHETVQFSADAVNRAHARGLRGASLLDAATARPRAPSNVGPAGQSQGQAQTPGVQQDETATSYPMGVLVLKYFPLAPDGQHIDATVTGDVDEPYSEIRQRTVDGTNYLLDSLSKATTYRASAGTDGQPSLRYSVVDTKELTNAVPMVQPSRRPAYRQMMLDQNICSYVDGRGVREVWLWAYQGPTYPGTGDIGIAYLSIYESIMGSRFGDISNSYRDSNLPVCANTYRVYTFNYHVGAGYALHSWSHQIESELNEVNRDLFEEKFEGPRHPRETHETGRCGSVHNPPNALFEYDYQDTVANGSDCLGWSPDSLGPISQIQCAIWSCAEVSFHDDPQLRYLIWFWQNLPGRGNDRQYEGGQLRNFWDVHGNFDATMSSAPTLFLDQSVTVARAGTGGGTVTSHPSGISCGGQCRESYKHGTVVTLTASPVAGSTFAGWGGACSGTGGCTVSVDGAKTVIATFQRSDVAVSVERALAPSGGDSMLSSTLTARSGCGAIDHIQFRPARNTRVSVTAPSGGPMSQAQTFTYTPPVRTTSVSLAIARIVPSGGAMVNVTFYDGCGAWPTFVGGGPSAFH